MKFKKSLAVLLLLCPAVYAEVSYTDNTEVIFPGKMASIPVSSKGVNYFHCENGAITDRSFSEERPLMFSLVDGTEGKDAFVKFRAMQNQDGTMLYYTDPAELYITCDNQVFSLVLNPTQNSLTKQFNLRTGKAKDIEKASIRFSEQQLEGLAVDLIDKVAYTDIADLPATYAVTNLELQWTPLNNQIRASEIRQYKVEGIGLILHEFVLFADLDTSLDEWATQSLWPSNAFAVRLNNNQLRKGQSTKLYIIDRIAR